jgi:hypothetical protein
MGSRLPAAAVGAWLLVAVYYFYQYALRSAPSVMMLQLTEAFGVINFINFTFSALPGPVFGSRLVEVPEDDTLALAHYQAGFQPLLYDIALAMILTCFLKETGPAVRWTAVEPLPANAS